MEFPNVERRGFDALMGIEYLEYEDDFARARLAVTPDLLQPHGIVNGGVHCALAESLASHTTGLLVAEQGLIAVASANNTSFLRPVGDGTLHADARRRHRGRTTWIWDVDVSDDHGRVCATARITLAVRPAPGAQPE